MKNKVGLGTFPLAGVFNPITPKNAEKIIERFLDLGGYYIDTAPLYGNGHIEELLGKTLKKYSRDKYYLITKTVKIVDENGNLFKSGRKNDIKKGLEWSLARLKLDYVDQLMVHSPDDTVPISETLDALEELQKVGKVREISISNVNLNELEAFNKSGKIKYIQNKYSLINRSINYEFENYLLKNSIFLIPYHLLEIGLLTGIAFEDYKLRTGDLREKLSYWNEDNQKVIFEWVRNELSPISKKLGITIGQLNIAWALQQKIIDFVIVGTTNPEYLEINLKANEIKLESDTLKEIEIAYEKFKNTIEEKYRKSVKEFRGLNDKYY